MLAGYTKVTEKNWQKARERLNKGGSILIVDIGLCNADMHLYSGPGERVDQNGWLRAGPRHPGDKGYVLEHKNLCRNDMEWLRIKDYRLGISCGSGDGGGVSIVPRGNCVLSIPDGASPEGAFRHAFSKAAAEINDYENKTHIGDADVDRMVEYVMKDLDEGESP